MKKRRLFLKYDLERILTLGYVSKLPQRQLVLGYLSYIIVGTLLLLLPFSTKSDVSLIDHLFTITSAVSTTGLCTVSVGDCYTFWGQLVILLMIQLGGLGYMTLSSYIMYRMTRHFMRIKYGVLQAEFAMPANIEIGSLVRNIIRFTFGFELVGAIMLTFFFIQQGVEDAIWSAIFHSVSSFCTAGFSLYNDSLIQFKGNFGVNIVIMILSYAGAMGFIVITDLWNKLRRPMTSISFTTKIIFLITGALTVWGTAQLFWFEPSLKVYPVSERFLISLFQTMSAMTTVGFNTVNLDGLVSSSMAVLIFAMYIGASPSGTGGGLKSTTLSAVIAYIHNKLGLRRHTYIGKRRLPDFRVDSAITTFLFYTLILFLGVYLLTLTDGFSFEETLFEAASALGTVGLSTGVTASFSVLGKFILLTLMYIGRVGVLTLGNAMLVRMARSQSYIEDDIVV